MLIPPEPERDATPPAPKRAKVARECATNQIDDMNTIYIQDQVHAVIPLSGALKAIVDTPQFQRLRHIKQLGAVDHVYPGAEFTRFQHSLGVCHLSGKLVRRLRKKLDDRLREVKVTDVDVLCVQIAGLCHDLGHGPFSHLFDGKVIKRIAPEQSTWKHEQASTAMFDYLLEENEHVREMLMTDHGMSDIDFTFVKEAIDGIPRGSDKSFIGRTGAKRFLYDIVSNKKDGFDVDRFDYFLRDSIHTSVSTDFNALSLKRIIKSARVMLIPETGEYRIAYAEKVIDDLNSAASARFRLHKRVYQHKTNKIIEELIARALESANDRIKFKDENGKLLRMSDTITNMSAYSQLDDRVLYLIEMNQNGEFNEAKQWLNRIHRRELFKLMGQIDSDNPAPLGDHEMKDALISLMHSEERALLREQLIVIRCDLHHGSDQKNPLLDVYVYPHKQPNPQPYRLGRDDPADVDRITNPPKSMKTYQYYVFFTDAHRLTDVLIKHIDEAIDKWSKQNRASVQKHLGIFGGTEVHSH